MFRFLKPFKKFLSIRNGFLHHESSAPLWKKALTPDLFMFPYVDIRVYTSSLGCLFSHKVDSQVSLTSGLHDCGLWIAWKGTFELYKPKKTVYNIRCNILTYLPY